MHVCVNHVLCVRLSLCWSNLLHVYGVCISFMNVCVAEFMSDMAGFHVEAIEAVAAVDVEGKADGSG